MREIEVKAKLEDKVRFLEAAKNLGIEFGDVLLQEDKTYETKLPNTDPEWNIFRLRKQENKIILTMKHKASLRSRDNYEYETVVENEADTIKMLERLGYFFGIGINKQRRTAEYKGLELCLDEIEQLGCFVEVEKLTDGTADVDKVQAELWSLLSQLGIADKDQIHKGYDRLMHDLKDIVAE